MCTLNLIYQNNSIVQRIKYERGYFYFSSLVHLKINLEYFSKINTNYASAEDLVELLLMATPLHLGLESFHTLGQAADVRVGSLVVLDLGLVDLHMVLLDVSQQLLGGDELPVQPGLLAGDAGVFLLPVLDLLLPPVDRGEMGV